MINTVINLKGGKIRFLRVLKNGIMTSHNGVGLISSCPLKLAWNSRPFRILSGRQCLNISLLTVLIAYCEINNESIAEIWLGARSLNASS